MVLQLEPVPALGAPIGPEWRRWGPYLSERQWGTVREDYSEFGEAWDSFPHDQARSRAYRWGEDGLLGISDDQQVLCFAIALWNGADPILKERLFGLTGSEGNHGEDVKEYYYYLDATPSHSYLKGLYKYPHRTYPYDDLLRTNRARGRHDPEYELIDTGVFDADAYFDVQVEYAKMAPDDIAIRISATNRGIESAPLSILPTLWFRNTWSWGDDIRPPILYRATPGNGSGELVHAEHATIGDYWLACEGEPDLLFTENVTNAALLWGGDNATPFVKDGINAAVVGKAAGAVNPAKSGTKCAAHYQFRIEAGQTTSVHLRLSKANIQQPWAGIDDVFATRQSEADAFYTAIARDSGSTDEASVQRQALAGLI